MKKYIIFIGLNDKNTKNQEITTLDAFKIVSNLACQYIGYATITEARGVYTHDDGTIIEETTLRAEISGADLESVKRFAEAAKLLLIRSQSVLRRLKVTSHSSKRAESLYLRTTIALTRRGGLVTNIVAYCLQ